ncbi:hypothetical protein E2C01_010503 [Portunus trituberculatus]|uniref:Uncharacterized protein n=1 Tax=Portunus trituberculatus TaxID=210409 RepID=A0A5B7D8M5_PORTR|nr:hypothetical protein [Portunus trituberculatus]
MVCEETEAREARIAYRRLEEQAAVQDKDRVQQITACCKVRVMLYDMEGAAQRKLQQGLTKATGILSNP